MVKAHQGEIEGILLEIQKKLKQVKRLRRQNKDTDIIMAEIWALSKEKFVMLARTNPELKSYEGIIYTVGMTPEPIILSILANGPKFIYFIVSKESEQFLSAITKEGELDLYQYKTRLIPSDSASEAYHSVKKGVKFLTEVKGLKHDNIALDPTGGTKIMSMGCGIAATILNLDILYVNYKKYDVELRRPEPGTEMLLSIPRPFNISQEDLKVNVLINSEEIEYELGVFISYSTLDSERFHIPEVVAELESYPEIDKVLYWKEHSKGNIIEFMETHIGNCEIFILFCSEKSKKSKAVMSEWMAAFQLLKEGKVSIIPVYENEDDIPVMLKPILNVEFTKDDIKGFVEALYREVLR